MKDRNQKGNFDEQMDNTEENKNKKKKLTKKERKELAKQQAEYEKELVKEGKIAPRYRYVPRNGFARILSVCVAFVFGFFAAFGVLVGGLAIFGDKKSIKEVTSGVGFDYSGIFSDYSAELSSLDFIVEIVKSVQGGEFTTLGNVAKYISFADTLADTVVTQLGDAGVTVEKDEFMAVPFIEIGGWLQEKLSGYSADLTLGKVITINEKSPLILQTLKNEYISNLGERVKTLRLCEMVENMDDNKLLRNLKDCTLSTLSAKVASLTVEEVFGEEMYCYLSLEESGGMTYNDMIEAYENTYRFDEEQSDIRPNPIELQEGEEIQYDEIEECYYLYRNGVKADKLDQYLDGTWYLLFGSSEKMGKTPILEMGTNVVDVIDKVNTKSLWWLWLHNIIKVNPYKELSGGKNLNEFNLKEFIDYVKDLPQIP